MLAHSPATQRNGIVPSGAGTRTCPAPLPPERGNKTVDSSAGQGNRLVFFGRVGFYAIAFFYRIEMLPDQGGALLHLLCHIHQNAVS